MAPTAVADRHEASGLSDDEIFGAVALVGHTSLHRRRCEECCTARLRHVVRLAEGLLLAVGAEDPFAIFAMVKGLAPQASVWCGGNAANGYPLIPLGGWS